jgi:hypothetical protein
MITKTCKRCGSQYGVKCKSWARLRKFCSKRCACLAYKETNPPERQPAWKGGKIQTNYGYIMSRVGRKYVLEHRHVMELHLGRKLKSSEDVHHVNGLKSDNRLENLIVMTKANHQEHHHRKHAKWHPCPVCGTSIKRPDTRCCSRKCAIQHGRYLGVLDIPCPK